MRRYGNQTRRELFETIDRPALGPLPVERFVYAQWKQARVNIDYHIEFDKHYYSVPFKLVREVVQLRATAVTIEIFHKNHRVASHARSYHKGSHTTNAQHMPKAHQAHLEWTPSRLISWAAKIGPNVEAMVCCILADRPHPEQGYRSCLGIMRLAKHYSAERLDAACARGIAAGARSYRHLNSILKHGLDRVEPDEDTATTSRVGTHENVRGSRYYH